MTGSGGSERARLHILPQYGVPGADGFGKLEPHRRDAGELDLDHALDRLREAYEQLDAVVASKTAARTNEKTAMDLVK